MSALNTYGSRLHTAYHEAAHAVVAHQLGSAVNIKFINSEDVIAQVTPEDSVIVSHSADDHLFYIAGYLTEAALYFIRVRFGSHVQFASGLTFQPDEIDLVTPWILEHRDEPVELEYTLDYIFEHGYGDSVLLNIYKDITIRRFIEKCFEYITSDEIWIKIWAVAEALLDKDELTSDEVKHLIRNSEKI